MKTRPPKTVGRPAPRALELELRRAFAPMLAQVRATLPKIKTPADARALGVALRKRWPDKRIRAIVLAIGKRAEARASMGWTFLAARVKPKRSDGARIRMDAYDGEALVDRWSKEATSKIKSVRDEIAEAMRKDVKKALEAGTDPAELAAKWKAEGIPVEFGTVEGRMKVIAQHQLSVLHSNVQAERAKASGVTEFFWRTQGDDKVRPLHAELGKPGANRYSYDDPDTRGEGLPGEPVNCRCYAESIIPDDLLAEFEGAITR